MTEEYEELVKLREIATELGDSVLIHGGTLIADDYFETYARDLADDLGYTQRGVNWPYTHIDWEAAADELKSDYSCFEIFGSDYWTNEC